MKIDRAMTMSIWRLAFTSNFQSLRRMVAFRSTILQKQLLLFSPFFARPPPSCTSQRAVWIKYISVVGSCIFLTNRMREPMAETMPAPCMCFMYTVANYYVSEIETIPRQIKQKQIWVSK